MEGQVLLVGIGVWVSGGLCFFGGALVFGSADRQALLVNPKRITLFFGLSRRKGLNLAEIPQNEIA